MEHSKMTSKTNEKAKRKTANVQTESKKPEAPTPEAATPVNGDIVRQHVREALEKATATFAGIQTQRAELAKQATGSYSGTLAAAREAGTYETFKSVWEGLKADISENVAGIAVKLGCKPGKTDTSGKTTYKVPAGMQVATSVILGAMAYGIALTDKDGKPRSFTDIREAKSIADAEKAKRELEAKATPAEKARMAIAEMARKLAANVSALTETEATEVAKIMQSVLATVDGSVAREAAKAEAAKKAA